MARDRTGTTDTPGAARGLARLGTAELRRDLATALRRAEAGERLVVSVDGRPVAQLGPLEVDDRSASIEDLVARGQLVTARRADRPDADLEVPLWAGTRLDRLVAEIRGR